MRQFHTLAALALVLFAAVLVGCGGGGGHAVTLVPSGASTAAPGTSGTQSVTISLNIPGRTTSAGRRNAAYIGAGTQAATFSATAVVVTPMPSPGATSPPVSAPTPSASTAVNCTATCTATLTGIPYGMVTFAVTLYDQPLKAGQPQGNVVSAGSATVPVGATTTSVSLTFNGVPVAVQLNPVSNPIANPSPAATQTTQVAMSVQDADGNTIVAASPQPSATPVPLSAPYTFTTSQSAHVTLSPSSVSTTGGMLTLTYDGALPTGTLVKLYSQNAAVNGGAALTAGSILIGASPGASASPTPAPSPSAVSVAGTFPIIINNQTGIPGAVNVYVYGLSPADDVTGEYVTNATTGAFAQFPAANTVMPASATLPQAGGQINVPQMCGARIYVAVGGSTLNITLSSAGVVPPAPWTANDPSINQIFDVLEYTWTTQASPPQNCPDTAMGLDETAVDDIGIPLSFQLFVANAPQGNAVGLQPYAGTNVALGLNALGGPWPSLIQTYTTAGGYAGTRIMNPSHAIAGAGQAPAPFNFRADYLDAYMQNVCTTYSTQDLHIGGTATSGATYIPGYQDVYGRYSGTCGTSSETLTFYSQPNMQGAVVATFTGKPSTVDALGNAGYFAPQSPQAATFIGRVLSVSLVRSTIDTSSPSAEQPVCSGSSTFYGGALTNAGTVPNASVVTDWYSALAHAFAYSNSVYAFADDDECSLYAPYLNAPATVSPGTSFVVTLHPF